MEFGGYEAETASLVEGLRERHEVLVLTSDRGDVPAAAGVRRELPYVGPKKREAFIAPSKAARAVKVTHDVLEDFAPDLVYVANSVAIPQSAPLTAATSGLPIAYRLSELFMAGSLYAGDRYLRNLLPGLGQSAMRSAWAATVRMHNRRLGLQPHARHRAAVSWGSRALRERVVLPASIEPVLQRTIYPASKHEAAFGSIERAPAAQPTVLYIGRVTPAKGIAIAYRALAELRREHGIDARLVQVGPTLPEMAAALQRLAAELDLTDVIDHHGQLGTNELVPLLAEAGALVLPTVEWEAFGLVIVEAGLARVPIVAAWIGGVPEVVTDGEHALLFEPGDVSGCAAALAEVFRYPDAAAERAEHARERMRQFSVARYREESERFLTEAAEALS
jgi:glycosyltransferase involved in cell wall biosynthesis